jgi:hypothetical protein
MIGEFRESAEFTETATLAHWTNRGLVEWIEGNFKERERQVAFTSILHVAELDPEIARRLGIEIEHLDIGE